MKDEIRKIIESGNNTDDIVDNILELLKNKSIVVYDTRDNIEWKKNLKHILLDNKKYVLYPNRERIIITCV
jgi:hypothetical protein